MPHSFRFLLEPSEFWTIVENYCADTKSSIWKFEEAGLPGKVMKLSRPPEPPVRLVWIGTNELPEAVNSSIEAGQKFGFACIVPPVINHSEKTLLMGELFTPADEISGHCNAFRLLKRKFSCVLKYQSTPQSIVSGIRGGRGPRMSDLAFALSNRGYHLRQYGVANIVFVPRETIGNGNGTDPE